MTTLVSSSDDGYGLTSYLWSDGTEVTYNRERDEWTSRQIPHPALHPSRFVRSALDLTLAPDVAVDD